MKNIKILVPILVLIILLTFAACSDSPGAEPDSTGDPVSADTSSPDNDNIEPQSKSEGQIYLYGEAHSVESILEKEFELWSGYYHNEGMRHLFMESPYYTEEFLNIWMKSDSDEILDEIYNDWEGSLAQDPLVKEFYQRIKSECPETIFHGTDVGHQYDTTGERFLTYLEDNGQKDSEEYLLAQEAIEQGKYFYENSDDVYRENKMAENFIREFDSLSDESVMGIYGGAHTGLDAMDYTNSVASMAAQLKERYGDSIYSEDLSWIAKDIEPFRTETITVGEKDYEASFFGEEDLTGFKDFSSREFWRLENAYDDFKDAKKTGDNLPYYNYPMIIEEEQIFLMIITKTDGSILRLYHRSNGNTYQGDPATEGFMAD